jgi:hypothetical protein
MFAPTTLEVAVPTQRSATLALAGLSPAITVEPMEEPVVPPPVKTSEPPVEVPEPDRHVDPVPAG